MGKKAKTVAPRFEVEDKKTDEYIGEHIAEKINEFEFRTGPCVDKDSDVPILTGFGSPENVDILGADRNQMRIAHDGNVGAFLQACPHLDSVRALELLSEFSLKEAIVKGNNMIMTPRGYVAPWIVSQIHDPTDRHFRDADKQQEKFEREVRRLGAAYEPAPVQKIRNLKKSIMNAADPAKVDECYKRVNWQDALEAERKHAAKLAKLREARLQKAKKGKKIPKKEKKSAIKKVESKKIFKCSSSNKKTNKVEVKFVKKNGKNATVNKKKDVKTVSTTEPCDVAGPSNSTKSATKSSTKCVGSSSLKVDSTKNSISRKIAAKKIGTKIKKITKKIQKKKDVAKVSATENPVIDDTLSSDAPLRNTALRKKPLSPRRPFQKKVSDSKNVATAKKEVTKVKKVEKTNETDEEENKPWYERAPLCDKKFVPFTLPPHIFL